MEYYAHKNKNENKDEKLITHLERTATLSKIYGDEFGNGNICRQLALLHDVGKRTVKFQDVLEGKEFHQDHAIVAGVIYNTFGFEFIKNKWLREQMSLIMAGHHSTLYSDKRSFCSGKFDESKYCYFDGSVFIRETEKKYVVSSIDEYNAIKQYIYDNNLLQNINQNDYFDVKEMSENEKMLYTRLLYSCLVDADYSATSAFCNNSLLDPFIDKSIDAEFLLNKLTKRHNDLSQSSDKSAINTLRNRVYDSCCEKGRLDEKFFTLTAPTGTGKTLALMAFALEHAKKFHKNRIFVILPYLSIINQNAGEYKRIFGNDRVLVVNSQTDYDEETKLDAERYSAEIIVTTSVHFFEMMFESKASRMRGLHNIVNSVIVFDECQTLSPHVINPTIEALQFLTKYCNSTVLFSTATQPAYEYRNHNEIRRSDETSLGKKAKFSSKSFNISDMVWSATEIIDDVQKLFDEYAVIKNTEIIWTDSNQTFDYPDLIDFFGDIDQVLYVFNTVPHALEMYRALQNKYDKENCYLITGRFCSCDKRCLVDEVNDRLKAKKPVYLASTQCIEAGVDFDFKAGARAYAPMDSVAQTAGRINRNGKNAGKMLVFKHENYPSKAYQCASESSLHMIESKPDFNFYNTSDMDEYYKNLYALNGYSVSSSNKLFDAMMNLNYNEVSRRYRLVEDGGQFNIIVKPFHKNAFWKDDADAEFNKGRDTEEQFYAWINDIIGNNYTITKDLMKKLSKYTLSCYRGNFDPSSIATQLSFRSHSDSKTNWYLLLDLDNKSIYSDNGFTGKDFNVFMGF